MSFHVVGLRIRRYPPTKIWQRFAPVRSKNLAKQITTRGSFHSCPDLSTLQISSLPQPPNGANDDPSGIEGELVTAPPSRSTSPDAFSLRSGPRKLVSTKKRVSRKARGVLGKVRAFQRIAAAKMAHPTIKIDTNVQATKRALSEDNDEGFDVLDGPDQDDPGLEAGDTESVPPFLCQSVLGWFALVPTTPDVRPFPAKLIR